MNEPTHENAHRPAVPLHAVPQGESGANAGVREAARARLTALPEPPPERRAEHRALAELRRWVTPPDPRKAAPPTWDQLRWNGDHGRHTPTDGWPHTVSVAWSRTVALPARAVAVWLDWIARCPARCLAVFLLYALIAHLPGMGWLPWFF